MRTHHGQGKKKLVEGAPAPRPTKRERFVQRLRAQLPVVSRAACDDLPRHTAYILEEGGSRVRAPHLYGNAAGRTLYVSRVARNREVHALSGNTVRRHAAAKVKAPVAKATAPKAQMAKDKAQPQANPKVRGALEAQRPPSPVHVTGVKTKAQMSGTTEARASSKSVSDAFWVHLDNVVVDHTKCLARIWAGGAGGQCTRPRVEKTKYCKQHADEKTRKRHGCVIGGITPEVQALFNDFARRVRKASGYEWYSRVKLWDEAQLIDKAPADLTDEEFKRALYNINRFFRQP